MITDEEIRAALDHVAGRAPDADRIRAGLAARARVYRQRRALIVAGGAVAAAGALGLPAVLTWRDRGSGETDRQFGSDERTAPNLPPVEAEPPPRAGGERVPMRYRPTWLPLGFVETSRTAVVADDGSRYQVREWRRAEDALVAPDQASAAVPYVRLVLAPVSQLDVAAWRPPVSINGDDGGLSVRDEHVPQVVWKIEKRLRLAVELGNIPDARAVALLIARSVKPDGVSGVECPLRFRGLPDFLASKPQQLTLSRWGSGWRAVRSALVGGSHPIVTAEYGPGIAPPPAGVRTTLRGRPALSRTYLGDAGGWAHVTLDGGLDLLLTAESGDEATGLVERLEVGPEPYRGWMGQR